METIQISENIRARIEQDEDPMSPLDWDRLGEIAYSSSRYTLGTQSVSRDRLDEIAKGIEKGDLIGLPVYAYVHSGSTIAVGTKLKNGTYVYGNPFSCPWDSGQSGFVYCTKAQAIKEFGKKILTERIKTNVLKCLAGEVESFDMYLQGDVWGVIVEEFDGEDWNELESCWGFYGFDYAKEEAKRMGEYQLSIAHA